jgi:hypothetical protein
MHPDVFVEAKTGIAADVPERVRSIMQRIDAQDSPTSAIGKLNKTIRGWARQILTAELEQRGRKGDATAKSIGFVLIGNFFGHRALMRLYVSIYEYIFGTRAGWFSTDNQVLVVWAILDVLLGRRTAIGYLTAILALYQRKAWYGGYNFWLASFLDLLITSFFYIPAYMIENPDKWKEFKRDLRNA